MYYIVRRMNFLIIKIFKRIISALQDKKQQQHHKIQIYQK